ncbi:hypothetical protein PTKIN_Ptkin04bG0206200 [Pterospermum kingtungense]
MAEDIEELCSKLSLGNEEDKDDEIILDEKWLQVSPELEIKEVGERIFLFKFKTAMEKAKVLLRQPWFFNKSLLVMQAIDGSEDLEGLEIIGEVLEVEMSEKRRVWGKWIRVRVVIDVTKPLKKGCWLTIIGGKRVWTTFKFERLPDFCFVCGRLTHLEKDCQKAVELQMSNQPVLKCFDHSLRADGLKVNSFLSSVRASNGSSVPLSNDQKVNLLSKHGGGAVMLHEETGNSHSMYQQHLGQL